MNTYGNRNARRTGGLTGRYARLFSRDDNLHSNGMCISSFPWKFLSAFPSIYLLFTLSQLNELRTRGGWYSKGKDVLMGMVTVFIYFHYSYKLLSLEALLTHIHWRKRTPITSHWGRRCASFPFLVMSYFLSRGFWLPIMYTCFFSTSLFSWTFMWLLICINPTF